MPVVSGRSECRCPRFIHKAISFFGGRLAKTVGSRRVSLLLCADCPFNYNKGEGKGKNSVYLREAQSKCLKLIPSSGMIVLTDIGDSRTIHPMEKETVGNRFAYLALGRTYGKKGFPVTGPLYKSLQTEDNQIIVSFDETGKGLTTFHQPMDGFEIAGEDKVFHPAKASLGKDAQTVIVSSPQVERPVAVRYAFKNYTKGCLYNMSGLPASSFRTDNW